MKQLLCSVLALCLAAAFGICCTEGEIPVHSSTVMVQAFPAAEEEAIQSSRPVQSKSSQPTSGELEEEHAGVSSVQSGTAASSEEETSHDTPSPVSSSQSREETSSIPSAQSSADASSFHSSTPSTPAVQEQTTFVLYDGATFMQVANKLERRGICSAKDFYRASQQYTAGPVSVPASASRCFRMEGYLYPGVYTLYTNSNAEEVLSVFLGGYASASGMPSSDTLTLASIIELEATDPADMALVASVYHNRLNAGMKLQADPTRAYVSSTLADSPFVSNASQYNDLYNTYDCYGLPAGPICNPGANALFAAENPAQTDYLFFFCGKDGKNHYSSTYTEHLALLEQYGYGHQ